MKTDLLLPLDSNEKALLAHVTMFGAPGYPVRKLGRKWIVDDAFGVKGLPTVFPTKTAAEEAFVGVYRMLCLRDSANR